MPAEPARQNFYTPLQRRLHWIVLLLILSQYLLQNLMREALASTGRHETLTFLQFLITTAHTWGGITIGAIMLWRWRLRKRAVPLNGGDITLSRARWVSIHHKTLYFVTLLMVLSGTLHYYLGLHFAGRWHELGKWLLLGLIVTHLAGALSHIGSGNMVLQRMMGRDSLR